MNRKYTWALKSLSWKSRDFFLVELFPTFLIISPLEKINIKCVLQEIWVAYNKMKLNNNIR